MWQMIKQQSFSIIKGDEILSQKSAGRRSDTRRETETREGLVIYKDYVEQITLSREKNNLAGKISHICTRNQSMIQDKAVLIQKEFDRSQHLILLKWIPQLSGMYKDASNTFRRIGKRSNVSVLFNRCLT